MKAPFWKRKLRQLGKIFGYQLIDANTPSDIFKELLKYRENGKSSAAISESGFLAAAIKHLSESKSQICQDLLVLYLTNHKKNGFFVEFGATDGITLSNTYLLEKNFAWSGLLAEPARSWHTALAQNRSCIIDKRCVWSESGKKLNFHEATIGELSTVDGFMKQDGHARERAPGEDYVVESVSLNDLLASHSAPRQIDFLSVDTEGSEYEILKNFDFSKYEVKIITVEHNYSASREKIHALLIENGYTRIFEGFSQWDDWYIKGI